MKMKAKGNTYKAKEVLKEAGFRFDGENKAWFGDESELEELKRITKAGYSRANQSKMAGVTVLNEATGEITDF